MTTKVAILTATTGAAVATDGTLDFPYAGANITVTEATKIAGSEVLSVSALQQIVDQAADTFTVAYDSDSATITYKGDTTIPAGSVVNLQVRVGGGQAVVLEQPNQVDSTTTSAATLASEFNDLLALLRSAGILVE